MYTTDDKENFINYCASVIVEYKMSQRDIIIYTNPMLIFNYRGETVVRMRGASIGDIEYIIEELDNILNDSWVKSELLCEC